MSLVLLAMLYGLYFLLLPILVSLQFDGVVGLFFEIAVGVGALIIPLVVFVLIKFGVETRAKNKIGRRWCEENGVDFVRVDLFKNHEAIIYRERGKTKRQKLLVHFAFLTWKVKAIEWL